MDPGVSRRRLCVSHAAWLLGVLSFGASGEAHAWTEAEVQSVEAELEVDADARAKVTLALGLRVHRGWLTGLDLDGLDEDLELETGDTIEVIGEDGVRHRATIRSRPSGRVELTFDRRDAPRRGTYRATLVYRTRLDVQSGTSPDRVRLGWSLPPFHTGLSGVRVTMLVPAGSEPSRDVGDPGNAVERHVEALEDHARVIFSRAHLPRTVVWNVAVDAPARAITARPIVPIPSPAAEPARHLDETREPAHPTWLVFTVLVAFVGATKRFTYRRACRPARVRPVALVPLPREAARIPSMLGLVIASALLEPASLDGAFVLLAAAVALVLERAPSLPAPPKLGSFRLADARDLRTARRARWFEALSPAVRLDATRISGALVAAGLGLLALAVDARAEVALGTAPTLAGVSLVLTPMLTGTRAELPSHPTLRLDWLVKAARAALTSNGAPNPLFAWTPLVYVAADGTWQDARIAIHPAHAPEGLLRLDLAVVDRHDAREVVSEVVVLATVVLDSPADRALAGIADLKDIDARSGRRARAASFGRALLEEVLESLASFAPRTAAPENEAGHGVGAAPSFARSELHRALADGSSAPSIARSTAEIASLP